MLLRGKFTGGVNGEQEFGRWASVSPGRELYNRSKDNLTDTELGQVRELLIEFQEVFSKSSMDLGRTSLVKHSYSPATAKDTISKER